MSGKPKPRVYNCATCGIEHINKTPKKVSRFCSRACTSRYKAVQFERAKPDFTSLSGRTRLIDGRIIVNEEFYDWLNIYKWHVTENGYAVSMFTIDGKLKNMRMHRLLMNAKDGQLIDHINRDKLDNRLTNLRFSNKSQNGFNTIRSDTARLYTYDKSKGKWAVLRAGKFYGRFKTEEEAKAMAETIRLMTQALPIGDR